MKSHISHVYISKYLQEVIITMEAVTDEIRDTRYVNMTTYYTHHVRHNSHSAQLIPNLTRYSALHVTQLYTLLSFTRYPALHVTQLYTLLSFTRYSALHVINLARYSALHVTQLNTLLSFTRPGGFILKCG